MSNTPETTDQELKTANNESGEHLTIDADRHDESSENEQEATAVDSTIEELRQCLSGGDMLDPKPDIKILPSDSVPSTPLPPVFGLDSQAPGNVVSFPDVAKSLRAPSVPKIDEGTEETDSDESA